VTPRVVYSIPRAVLHSTRDFLAARGAAGYEGCLLWVGKQLNPTGVTITRVHIPEQVATSGEDGFSVDLTPQAHWTLTDNLAPGEMFFIRVHSHPGCAYHSSKDDANRVLTHNGAISVVVPDFARDPIDLRQCAVYELDLSRGWRRLRSTLVRRLFHVIDEEQHAP